MRFDITFAMMRLICILGLILAGITSSSSAPRNKRAFPGTKPNLCQLDHQQLLDLNDALALQKTNRPITAIANRYASQKTSSDECKATFAQILSTVAELSTLSRDDHLVGILEKEKSHLQKLVDQLKRDSQQKTEIALDKQKQALQEMMEEVRLLKHHNIQLKKTNRDQALQLSRNDIEKGNIDEAARRFLALEDRTSLVANLIKETYTNLAVLKHVIAFANALVTDFTILKEAYSTIFQKMESNDHLKEKELMFLFYSLKENMRRAEFKALDVHLRFKFLFLQIKMNPHEILLMDILMRELRQNKHDRLRQLNLILDSKVLNAFLEGLVKEYYHTKFVDGKYPESLFKYLEILPSDENFCVALEVFSKELILKNKSKTSEGQQTLKILRKKLLEEHGNRSGYPTLSKCKIAYDGLSKPQK